MADAKVIVQRRSDPPRLEAVQRSIPGASSEHLIIDEPSPAEWDVFVHNHPHGHPLQLTAWGEFKSSSGWRARRVVVRTPAAIYAGAQVLVRLRYGVSVAYVPRGPLFADDAAVNAALLVALIRLARRQRAVFLRFEPNLLEADADADWHHTWLLLQGFHPAAPIQPRSSIHRDLAPSTEQLLAGFSKGHRADIRRAERQGVTVRIGAEADLDAFYAIMQATGVRAEFGIHAAVYYRRAWEAFQPYSRLLIAEKDGAAVAGHMVFVGAGTGLYLYGGALETGLKAGANHLLQWHAIRWAREQGCTRYDMWGIPDALGRAAAVDDEHERAALEAEAQNDPLIGVYRFKKGFGGAITRYLPAYDYVLIPPLYHFWQHRFR